MGEFKVHRVRFFEYTPSSIHCLTYDKPTQRLALSRADGTIEIWSKADNWFQEKVIAVCEERSVEGLVWLNSRLFTVGLDSYIVEYDLTGLQIKRQAASSAGAVWCVTKNEPESQLAVGTEDGCVVLFDTCHDTLQYLRAFDKLEGRILCIAWHAGESVIVTGGVDNIRIWGAKSGHALQRIVLGGKDTTVWCIAVTSDLTIISGDSRGKTTFWNGKQGTRIDQFQSHKADVLTLSISEDEHSVFSSGVDPTIVKYSFVPPSASSGWRPWVRSSALSYHTHDVRASTVADNTIVTGGVDTSFICCQLSGGKKQKYVNLPALPSSSLVSVAKEARVLLLRYPTCLELWRLGNTNASVENHTSGDVLPLCSSKLKLLQLRARQGERITCSTISSDGTIIAFSDQDKIRAHRLTLKDISSLTPSVEISRLSLDARHNLQGAHRLAVTPDNGRLVAATSGGFLQFWDISKEKGSLLYTVSPEGSEKPTKHCITNLCISDNGKLAATSNTGGSVHVFSLKDGQLQCSLPTLSRQATAINFSPAGKALLVAYSDHSIYEFDVSKEEYTSWSRKASHQFPDQWLQQRGSVQSLFCRPDHQQTVLAHSQHSLLVVNKKEPMPEKKFPLFKKHSAEDGPSPLIACSIYKYILHAEFLSADTLVVVERTPMDIQDQLDPSLQRKKFGT